MKPPLNSSRLNLDVPPVVLLFYHLPKCAGTTIRELFSYHGWFRTFWSNTQHPTGRHANRLLRAVAVALRSGEKRIFAELHIAPLNWTAIPDMERAWRTLVPNLRFRAFTVIRPPLSLLASNGQFWYPWMPPDVYIKFSPEQFLLRVILADTHHMARFRETANGSAVCERQHALCSQWAEASRPCGRSTCQPSRYLRRRANGTLEEALFDSAIRAATELGAVEAALAAAGSCAPLVAAALVSVAPVHFILNLADNSTFPRLHTAARGNLAFTAKARPLAGQKPDQTRHYLPSRKQNSYTSEANAALAREKNRCSLELFEALSSRLRAIV
jgi:hypothetical protein